jgi:hypothetical protein
MTTTDGLERLGRLTALHCIPYDYANSLASDSLVQVMRTMSDVASGETLAYLQKLVKASLEETKEFWGSMEDQSKLLPLLEITGMYKCCLALSFELLKPSSTQRNKNKKETNASEVSLLSISASRSFRMFSPLQATLTEGPRSGFSRPSWVIRLQTLCLTWALYIEPAYGKIYFSRLVSPPKALTPPQAQMHHLLRGLLAAHRHLSQRMTHRSRRMAFNQSRPMWSLRLCLNWKLWILRVLGNTTQRH